MFQGGQSSCLSLKHHLPPIALYLMFLTAVAKDLELNTFKEDERVHIRGSLSNWQSFYFLVMYFFLKCAKHSLSLSLYPMNSHIQFLFCADNFATLSKSSYFITKWCGLRLVEGVWRLMFRSTPPEALSLAEQEQMANEVSSIEKLLVFITATIIML